MKKACISRLLFFVIFANGLISLQLFGQEESASLTLENQLERGIYLQEGKADLSAAAKVYESILEESKLLDSLAAETRYRLAVVYLEQGKRVQAMHLLKEIVDEFPNESRWVVEAKELLPKEFVPEEVPWKDGERTHYDWQLPTGDVLGKSFGTIFKFEWEGRSLWRKESRYRLNGDRATAVEFDQETFNTLYSNMSLGEMGNIRTWYGEDALSAKVQYSKSGEEREFDFPERVYDNEQAYELMRQMPSDIGYKTHLTLFTSFAGAPVGVTFEVVGIEDLDTALGTVECFHIVIDLIVQKQSVYITNDDRRLIVKFVVGGVEGVLTEVETVDYDGKGRYVDPEFGYSIEYPGSWGTMVLPKSKRIVRVVEPMARGDFLINATLKTNWKSDDPLSLESMESFLKKEIPEDFKGFEFVDSWSSDTRLPLPQSASLKLEKKDGENVIDAYVHYGIGEEAFFVVVGKIPDYEEDELLPIFNQIVASFRLGD